MDKYGQIYAIEIGGSIYVGKAIGSSISRWSTHIRNLKSGKHHCAKLQNAFDKEDITSATFKILKDKVHEDFLTHEECRFTKELGGINEMPSHILREEKQAKILDDIKAGIAYRRIAELHNVSLGTISGIKTKSHI